MELIPCLSIALVLLEMSQRQEQDMVLASGITEQDLPNFRLVAG